MVATCDVTEVAAIAQNTQAIDVTEVAAIAQNTIVAKVEQVAEISKVAEKIDTA